ncbi:MAG: DinB family protein [Anaerolineae bacterium]|nr:DinB family protein [Anaerolineae bacterium]
MSTLTTQKLFAYNAWAWDRVFASVEKLDAAAYHAPQPFFWGSIHGLLVHCLAAEWIWYSRCQGNSPTTLLNPDDYPDFVAVRSAWQPIRENWFNYVNSLADEQMTQTIQYRNTRGQTFNLVLSDLLHHVMNHATEHRSQLTPTLYNLDFPTPPLDYMAFCLQQV